MAAAAVLAIPGAECVRAGIGAVRSGSRRTGHHGRPLRALRGRLGPAPGASAGCGRPALLTRQCARSHRDLGVLVVAQRALRSTRRQAAHGASGGRGRVWGLAGGVGAERVTALISQRGAFRRDRPCPLVRASPVLVLGRGMPAGGHGRRCRRKPERMGRDSACATPPWSRPGDRARGGAGRADGLPAQGGSRDLVWKGEPLVRFFGLFYAGTALAAFCSRRCSAARSWLGSGSGARWRATHCWWARPACLASLPRPHGARFFRAASMSRCARPSSGPATSCSTRRCRGIQAGCQVDGGCEC